MNQEEWILAINYAQKSRMVILNEKLWFLLDEKQENQLFCRQL